MKGNCKRFLTVQNHKAVPNIRDRSGLISLNWALLSLCIYVWYVILIYWTLLVFSLLLFNFSMKLLGKIVHSHGVRYYKYADPVLYLHPWLNKWCGWCLVLLHGGCESLDGEQQVSTQWQDWMGLGLGATVFVTIYHLSFWIRWLYTRQTWCTIWGSNSFKEWIAVVTRNVFTQF